MPDVREGIFANNSNLTPMGNSSQPEFLSILCGNPGFCMNGVYQECGNQPISECERCDVGLAATFLFFVICLGFAIILGNIWIILVGNRRRKDGKRNKMDLCKCSLALADMLTGVHQNFEFAVNQSKTNFKEVRQFLLAISFVNLVSITTSVVLGRGQDPRRGSPFIT